MIFLKKLLFAIIDVKMIKRQMMVNLVAKTCFFFLISVFLTNSSSIYIHQSASYYSFFNKV